MKRSEVVEAIVKCMYVYREHISGKHEFTQRSMTVLTDRIANYLGGKSNKEVNEYMLKELDGTLVFTTHVKDKSKTDGQWVFVVTDRARAEYEQQKRDERRGWQASLTREQREWQAQQDIDNKDWQAALNIRCVRETALWTVVATLGGAVVGAVVAFYLTRPH